MIEIENTRSSAIKKLTYDNHELTITFASGDTHKYKNFTKEEFNKLVNAESMGKHFHAHIKDKFESEKL